MTNTTIVVYSSYIDEGNKPDKKYKININYGVINMTIRTKYPYIECLKTVIFLLKEQHEELTRPDREEVIWGDCGGLAKEDYLRLIKSLATRFNLLTEDWKDKVYCEDSQIFIDALAFHLSALIEGKELEYNKLKQAQATN